MLEEYDHSFVPPLSSRSSTLEQSFGGDRSHSTPQASFDIMKRHTNTKVAVFQGNAEVNPDMGEFAGDAPDDLNGHRTNTRLS